MVDMVDSMDIVEKMNMVDSIDLVQMEKTFGDLKLLKKTYLVGMVDIEGNVENKAIVDSKVKLYMLQKTHDQVKGWVKEKLTFCFVISWLNRIKTLKFLAPPPIIPF